MTNIPVQTERLNSKRTGKIDSIRLEELMDIL